MLPEFYNELGAMHGTIMVFLGVVPLAVGGFGNFVLPLQIGAPTWPSPHQHGELLDLLRGRRRDAPELLRAGGRGPVGLDILRAPLRDRHERPDLVALRHGVPHHLVAARVDQLIVTTIQLRAPGLTWFRLPFFVWAQLVTSFLLLLAFPPLEGAAILQLMDRLAGTSFFMPSGLVVSGQIQAATGGGNPLLWQHLFWFLATLRSTCSSSPPWGSWPRSWPTTRGSPLRLPVDGLLGGLPRVHVLRRVGAPHVHDRHGHDHGDLLPGHDDDHLDPSVVVLTALILSLWGGSIRFTTPCSSPSASCPCSGSGAHRAAPRPDRDRHPPPRHLLRDRPLPLRGRPGHDLRPVRRGLLLVPQGHRPGDERDPRAAPLLGLPRLHERDLHALLPHGPRRRLAPPLRRGATYAHAQPVLHWNAVSSIGAWCLALFQVPFIFNFFWSAFRGRRVEANPGRRRPSSGPRPRPRPTATSSTPRGAPRALRVQRPRAAKDYVPQWEAAGA